MKYCLSFLLLVFSQMILLAQPTNNDCSFAPHAWIDKKKVDSKDGELGRVGYEISVTRYFYQYEPPRPLEEIETDIETVENQLLDMLKKLNK